MPVLRSEPILGVCGLLLLVLTAFGLTLPQPVVGQFGIGYGKPLDHFVVLECVQGGIYFAAVALILRNKLTMRTVWMILGFAGLLRLMVVVFPPFLSNDMYRYIWDGWVQAARINPYSYIPSDPHLAFLHDATVFPNINRANYAHTIYPPAAQMIFFIASSIGRFLAIPPVLAMKLTMLAFEGIGVWAMIRLLDHAGLPRTRILIYAWNPIPHLGICGQRPCGRDFYLLHWTCTSGSLRGQMWMGGYRARRCHSYEIVTRNLAARLMAPLGLAIRCHLHRNYRCTLHAISQCR